jgi:LysR family transcriptional regulator, glycine cleavage system transcriptional activator
MSDPLATLPLSAVRIFEAAARLRSFTRAAEELNITQAAVSWQVKALEQRLGQPLFQRLPREVVLTPSGERLARAATESLSILRSAVSDLTETDEGVLAITTLQTAATQWLGPRIGAFQLAHPKLAVRMETTSKVVDMTRENLDVAIRSGAGEWPGLESHFLFPNSATVVCSPEVRDRLGGLSRPKDVLDAPLIGIPEEWNAWFRAAGLKQARPEDEPYRLAADNQVLEIASALAGHGLVLASPIFFAADIAAGRLVRPFEMTIPFGAGYWLAYRKDRRRSPKIVAFRDWLLAAVAADPTVAASRPRT